MQRRISGVIEDESVGAALDQHLEYARVAAMTRATEERRRCRRIGATATIHVGACSRYGGEI